jgi:diaminopimelate decarboxylase
VPDDLIAADLAARVSWVDSPDELDALHSREVSPSDVLFRGTDGTVEEIRDAALRGVWRFECCSEWKLLQIAAAAPGAAVFAGLNAGPQQNDVAGARSGVSADTALRLLRMAPECGLRPYGLWCHVGSADPADWSIAIERCGLVMRRLEQLGARIEMLGIDGGSACEESDAFALAVARLPYRPALIVAA